MCLARTQVDYARAILSRVHPSDPRAAGLLAAAAQTAAELGAGSVARRVVALGGG